MKIKTLRDLYVDQLKDLHSAEKQLIAALPKMAKAADDPELREAFESHLEETRGHMERLDEILENLGVSSKGKLCKAMEGLIKESVEVLEQPEASPVRDAGLIAAAQRVEHYEMAGYGCVRSFAHSLGERDATALLQKTLDEEGAADKTLSSLAKSINLNAINSTLAEAK